MATTPASTPLPTVITAPTRAERANLEIASLFRARQTLLWIVTREEVRVEMSLVEAAGRAGKVGYPVFCWDCATGLTRAITGEQVANVRDPSELLAGLKERRQRGVYVLRDLHRLLDPFTLRALKSRAIELQRVPASEAAILVVLTCSSEVPPELSGVATVIEYPIPDRAEIADILARTIDGAQRGENARADAEGRKPQTFAIDEQTRERAVDAAVGLTAAEANDCYARSMVMLGGRIDPALVSAEKRRVVAREKVLTWHDPDPRGLEAVGGLDVLKGWIRSRRAAFGERARAFGLPAPRGLFLVGVPGTGKSLVSKCVASALQCPLLRLDLGAQRSKFVGESEGNIRRALALAETVAPCVLWVDEIDKALAGSTGQQGDGGVAADALGAVLSWMQERTAPVFVIATANDVRGLPPELLRKGRFDEVFWVDLPNASERAEILKVALAAHRRPIKGINPGVVVEKTNGFTGAEIAAIVPDALFSAFEDGERALTTADLTAAAANVTPLAVTAKEKIDELRTWARGRARRASSEDGLENRKAAPYGGRAIDV